MALSIGIVQRELHECSRNAMRAIEAEEDHIRYGHIAAHLEKVNDPLKGQMAGPTVPAPMLFFGLQEALLAPDSLRLPVVAECAVHLKLLHAINHLRATVLKSTKLDAVFGIWPEPKIVKRGRKKIEHKLKDPTFAERRKQKWPIFRDLAVSRFRRWFDEFEVDLAKPSSSNVNLHLPPLDILMVWHTFLLNPTMFRKYCNERKLQKVQLVAFPWAKIHSAINQVDWEYALAPDDSAHISAKMHLAPDLYHYLTNQPPFPSSVKNLLQRYGSGSGTHPLSPTVINYLVHEDDSPVDQTFIRCCSMAVSRTDINTQLSDAIERQASFVEKMEKQLWIRSPAAQGTLQRAIGRYERFLKLLKLYPGTMLVPTLDIDLVWHTHQCSSSAYVAATEALAGRFIDHDDKLATSSLDTGMDKTKALYRIRFGQEYSVCNCWDCEALLSALEGVEKGAVDADGVAEMVEKDVSFHREVEVQRRKMMAKRY